MIQDKKLETIVEDTIAPSQVPFFAARLDGSFYYRHDASGKLIFFSDSVVEVLAYSVVDCLKGFMGFLTGSPINDCVTDIIAASLKGERQEPFELEMFDGRGEIKRLEISMVPHYNDAGVLTSVESIAHDITRLHRALSRYRRKSFLLDEAETIAGMGTWDWNLLSDEVRWSQGFCKILRLKDDVTANFDTYRQFLASQDAEQMRLRIVEAIKNQQVIEFSHRIFLANGTVRYIESRAKTLVDNHGRSVRMIGTLHDITEQVEADSQLEKAYRLVNSSVNEIYLIDPENYRFTFASEGACRNLGYNQFEITQLTPFDLCPVIPKVQIMEMMAPVMENQEQVVFEASHQRKDGSSYPVEVRLQLMEQSAMPLFVAVVLDISSQKKAQQQAKDQAALLRSVIDATPDLIFFKDSAGRYLGCNKAFERFVQLNEQSIIGSSDVELAIADMVCGFDIDDEQVIKTGKSSEQKHWSSDVAGNSVLLQTTKTPYYNQQGEIEGVVGVSRDITKESQIQAELQQQRNLFEHDAHYDALTNLPNRVLFLDRLGQSISKAKRNKESVAVFFIDVDHFKPINDGLGHDIGDEVLQAVAKSLTQCVREMDTIARLGGDEFVAIIEGITNPQAAALIAHKMNASIREVMNSSRLQLQLSASIGISTYPEDGDTSGQLLKCADKAMYRVKQQGRDSFQFYAQDVTGTAFERALMESQLQAALVNDEFQLFYQAQMSINGDRVTGIEALVRWQHPQMGTILPEKFIPLAEDVGLIQAIDEWVLHKACLQMAQWKKQGLDDVRVAVNLSSSELIRNNLYETIVDILAQTECDPRWLELEIKENCVIGDTEQARRLLHKFSQLGISLVIDDFGTGYSSLVNLRCLPISKLKIDKSFINNVPQNSDDVSIAQAVIGLGKSLGLQVVAEGVETEKQQNFLQQQNCEKAQGYLFSYPVSAEVMTQKLLS